MSGQALSGGVNKDIPAGLGVLKPDWSVPQVQARSLHPQQVVPLSSAPHLHIHQAALVVPPCNPTISQPIGWTGLGGMQSTPGQVGVPLVPLTLLPQSLRHQDWFGDGKSSDGKNKRSKHWMRPDFYIPTEKRYDELLYRELMFGMISVAVCMARYNLHD